MWLHIHVQNMYNLCVKWQVNQSPLNTRGGPNMRVGDWEGQGVIVTRPCILDHVRKDQVKNRCKSECWWCWQRWYRCFLSVSHSKKGCITIMTKRTAGLCALLWLPQRHCSRHWTAFLFLNFAFLLFLSPSCYFLFFIVFFLRIFPSHFFPLFFSAVTLFAPLNCLPLLRFFFPPFPFFPSYFLFFHRFSIRVGYFSSSFLSPLFFRCDIVRATELPSYSYILLFLLSPLFSSYPVFLSWSLWELSPLLKYRCQCQLFLFFGSFQLRLVSFGIVLSTTTNVMWGILVAIVTIGIVVVSYETFNT